MPMLLGTSRLAAQGQPWWAPHGQLTFVLVNLGLLLPLVLLAGCLEPAGSTETGRIVWGWTPMVFPRVAWRVDSLALVILCLVHVPAATGHWRLGPWLAPWLAGSYAAYLFCLLLGLARL
jgi:hypothetical protein